MKTDAEAASSGIEPRGRCAEGMKDLLDAMQEVLAKFGAGPSPDTTLKIETVRDVCLILNGRYRPPPAEHIQRRRSELVQIRNGLLAAEQFMWAIMVTHAIWWLSVILEDVEEHVENLDPTGGALEEDG